MCTEVKTINNYAENNKIHYRDTECDLTFDVHVCMYILDY